MLDSSPPTEVTPVYIHVVVQGEVVVPVRRHRHAALAEEELKAAVVAAVVVVLLDYKIRVVDPVDPGGDVLYVKIMLSPVTALSSTAPRCPCRRTGRSAWS